VDCFVRALNLSKEPLSFPPELNLTEEDKALEARLRAEDVQRLKSEINKHKSWPGQNTQRFREKLEIAMQLHAKQEIASWTWVQQAFTELRGRRDYQKAEELLRDHLKANPGSDQGWIALVELSLERGDAPAAEAAFEKAFGMLSANPVSLRQLGNSINRFHTRMPKESRPLALGWAEKTFRRGIEVSRDPNIRAQLLFELSNTLDALDRPTDALDAVRKAIASTTVPEAAELWKLNLAEYLSRAGMADEARKTLEDLATKARQEQVRTTAQNRLRRMDEAVKKPPK